MSDANAASKLPLSKFKPSQHLFLLVAAFVVFSVLFTAAFSWHSWQSTKEREITYLSSVSSLGAKSLNAYFENYETSLKLLKAQILESGWPIDLNNADRLVKNYYALYPELGNVNISRPDGQFVVSAAEFPGPLPHSKQESFKLTTKDLLSGMEFTIGRPIFGKILGEWVIPMRTAVRNDAGELVYILSATLPLSRQQTFWQSIFLPEGYGMGMLRDDLFMLSRYPIPDGASIEKVYSNPRSGVVANFIKDNQFPIEGQGTGYNSVTGYESLFSFHRLDNFPLTLFVNIPTSGVYHAWEHEIKPFLLLVTIFLLVTVLAAYVFHRRRSIDEKEREQAAELLKESELRFRTLVENIPGVSYRCANDEHWSTEYISSEIERLTGYPVSDFINNKVRSYASIILEDDVKMVEDAVTEGLRLRTPYHIEYRIVHADDSVRWVYEKGQGVFSANDELLHLDGVILDITDAKRAEELLRRSEERFTMAMQGATDGLWDWNLETDEVYYSPQWKKMLGYEENEIADNLDSWIKLTHPDDTTDALDKVRDYMEGRSDSFEAEIRMKHKDGKWVHILSRAFLLRNDNHEPIRLIGTHVDQTERKRVEAETREALATLDATQDAAFIFDAETLVFRYVNEGAVKQLGYRRDELLAMRPVDIKPDYDETSFRKLLKPLLNGSRDNLHFQTLHRCKDGRDIPVEISLQYIELKDVPPRFVAIVRDITERKEAEESMQMAALVYQSSSQAMSVTDADGIIVTINPAFSSLTGYTADEIIGQPHDILNADTDNAVEQEYILNEIQQHGKWQGEVECKRKNNEVYIEFQTITCTLNEDGTVNHLVILSSDITEKKATEERIWEQANFDTLTGLPNRRMFRDRLEHKILDSDRSKQPLMLMFMDLDGFKEVNDTHGHDMGDLLLVEAANRLTACVRETDTVARMGGDEFTLIMSDYGNQESVERVCQCILKSLSEPFLLNNEKINVSGSIGVTFYPKDADDVDKLLKNADQAMYVAKREGRNRCSYFTPSIQKAVNRRIQLMNDLRRAIDNKEFVIHYQPIVEMASGKTTKAEALIRWHHPVRGLIGPNEFIPFAEQTGMINEIGNWVFCEVASQTAKWKSIQGLNLQISINKSPIQFLQDFNDSEVWVDYLNKNGACGKDIVVEITEGLLLDLCDPVVEQLLTFRDAGIQVSLDDFGTGYSTLSYLKRFDIDYLKIDRVFVENLYADSDDMILVEAIIMMAHKLGIKVIAEGVETESQRDLLIAAGSDYAQGYFYSKPVPVDQFEQWLNCKTPDLV